MLNEGLVRNRESFFVGHIPIGKDGEHERELDLRSRLLSLGIVHASMALRSLNRKVQDIARTPYGTTRCRVGKKP